MLREVAYRFASLILALCLPIPLFSQDPSEEDPILSISAEAYDFGESCYSVITLDANTLLSLFVPKANRICIWPDEPDSLTESPDLIKLVNAQLVQFERENIALLSTI